jgi:hypothetical protein
MILKKREFVKAWADYCKVIKNPAAPYYHFAAGFVCAWLAQAKIARNKKRKIKSEV